MKSKAQPKSGFSFADSERVERILSQYPDKKSATLPLLHLAQSQEGYISSSVIDTIADLVDCHPSVVMDCVSFYTMLYTKPQGRHIIQVCQTLSCSLNGADSLVDHIRDKYEIEPGGTTADDRFTLMKVECLGSCGTAPVVQVNNDYHEGLSIEEFDKLLESFE
ncbi:MAG: NAD(P)H-dependent oxidoreductase subunit E [Candidatus Marinimicrobia bacterium]|jgi:NADH-quinone oxidoreductase subunit E|nr:NAD(P)H-dependent oxidoreductase subunit E [Candidatus Neomarinimicrobiota bacterium]